MILWLRQLLRERSLEFYLLLGLLWLLPALALAGLGVVYLWQLGWLWWFGIALVALALLTTAARLLRQDKKEPADPAEHQIEPLAEWSERDRSIWRRSVAEIDASQRALTPWEAIPDAMLDQVKFVARQYHHRELEAEYAFTVPELLLMLETWSREYRGYIIDQLPLARQLKVSSLLRLRRGTSLAGSLYRRTAPLITLARVLIDPGAAVTSELRARLYAELGDGLGGHLQTNLKQALFEQVTQVAIELYSGRLKLSDTELASHRERLGAPEQVTVRPLSVLLLGQVNAGKSSLINALAERYVTEVDTLPATAGFRHVRFTLSDDLELFLVDSPGLDGKDETAAKLLQQAVNSDLILWLCQANQPAKNLDRELIEQINGHFDAHLQRKPPPVVLVTTHNDQLPPVSDWTPPYQLEPAEKPKARAMVEALNYNRQILGLADTTAMVAIALPPEGQAYHIDTVQNLLLELSQEARAVQLNRERLDAARSASLVSASLKTIPGLLRVGSQLSRKSSNQATRKIKGSSEQ